MDKIDIRNIISNHISTIKNTNTGKPDFGDFFTFIVLPIMISLSLSLLKIEFKSETTSIIITTLAIFVGLMFNIIVLIFDIVKRDASQNIKNIILKELLSNIAFAIILALSTIIVIIFTYSSQLYIKIVSTSLSFFLVSLFILTLLMILKRMYNVFKNEIDEIEGKIK